MYLTILHPITFRRVEWHQRVETALRLQRRWIAQQKYTWTISWNSHSIRWVQSSFIAFGRFHSHFRVCSSSLARAGLSVSITLSLIMFREHPLLSIRTQPIHRIRKPHQVTISRHIFAGSKCALGHQLATHRPHEEVGQEKDHQQFQALLKPICKGVVVLCQAAWSFCARRASSDRSG